MNRGSSMAAAIYLQIATKREWRDPDSNRGHHDFQLCGCRLRSLLTVPQSAYLSRFAEYHVCHGLPMFLVGWCISWCIGRVHKPLALRPSLECYQKLTSSEMVAEYSAPRV